MDAETQMNEVIDLTFSSDSDFEESKPKKVPKTNKITVAQKVPEIPQVEEAKEDIEMESLSCDLSQMNIEYIENIQRVMLNPQYDTDLTIIQKSLELMMDKLQQCHDYCTQETNLSHAKQIFIAWSAPKNIHPRYAGMFLNKLKKLDYSASYMKGMFTKMHKQFLSEGVTFPVFIEEVKQTEKAADQEL
jgi:hypothetical protein